MKQSELNLDSTPQEIKEYLYSKGYRSIDQISKASRISNDTINKLYNGDLKLSSYMMYKLRNLKVRVMNTSNPLDSTKVSDHGVRLNKLLELTGLSITKLSKLIDVSPQTLYSIRSEVKKKSKSGKEYEVIFKDDIALKICSVFPSINPNWIVEGELPILIPDINYI